jgi:hypothetical protein
MTIPKFVPYAQQARRGKIILLTVMCIVFGIEIGFKFSGKTFVYILNPCHIFTIAEVLIQLLLFKMCDYIILSLLYK